MSTIAELIEGLQNKDNNYANQCLKQLLEESELSNDVYSHFDTFAQMMDNPITVTCNHWYTMIFEQH